MRASLRRLAVLLLVARPAFAQMRVEPLAARISAAPAVSLALPSFAAALAAPSLAAPAPLFAPALTVFSAPAAAAIPAAASPAAAAAEGPPRPANDTHASAAEAPAPNDDAELPARSLNAFWDGFALPAQDDKPLFALPATRTGLLPKATGSASKTSNSAPWLALKDKKLAAALETAVTLARSTHSGRRAFAAGEKALGATPLPVDVLDLGRNYGEFDYIEGRLRLDRKLFNPGREAELAGTLAHELTHVAQHAQGLISNALELEIEAHLLDLALMDELGLTPPPHTFAHQAQQALKKSPEAFIELIQAAVPGSPFLGDSGFDEIADQLEQDLDDLGRKKSPRAAKLAAVVEGDLGVIRSKKGRAAYRAFSKRVLAELARRCAAAR